MIQICENRDMIKQKQNEDSVFSSLGCLQAPPMPHPIPALLTPQYDTDLSPSPDSQIPGTPVILLGLRNEVGTWVKGA